MLETNPWFFYLRSKTVLQRDCYERELQSLKKISDFINIFFSLSLSSGIDPEMPNCEIEEDLQNCKRFFNYTL